MSQQMNEYRFTRPHVYSSPDCPGHKNPSARQGYYIIASSEQEAFQKMHEQHPEFAGQRLDVQFWRYIS